MFLTWLTLGDTTWFLALIHRGVVPFLFVPAIPFLLVGILRRHYRPILLLFIPAILFFTLYSPYLIPHLVTTAPEPNFTVLTYNVLFTNKNYDAVAANILTYHPDLVALQKKSSPPCSPPSPNAYRRLIPMPSSQPKTNSAHPPS